MKRFSAWLPVLLVAMVDLRYAKARGWSATFGTSADNEAVDAVYPTGDGAYLMTSDNGRHLTKVSAAGEVIWSHLMQGVTRLFPAGSGFLVIVHNTNTLVRLNGLGEVVWWKTFDLPIYPMVARAFSDGSILIGTHANPAGNIPFIAKLTADGQIVWQMTVTVPGMTDAYLTDLLPLGDGTFLASMPAYHLQAGKITSSADYVVRFSSSGAVVWAKTLIGIRSLTSGAGVSRLGETKDGYFAFGNGVLIALDSVGNVKRFRTGLPYSDYYGVGPTADGGYMIAGTDFSVVEAAVQKLDRQLNNTWRRRLSVGTTSKLSTIAPTPAGGWIVGGMITPPGQSDSDGWIFRLGSGGEPIGSCPASVTSDSDLGNGFLRCEVQLAYPSPPPSVPIASVTHCDPPPVPSGFSPVRHDFEFTCGPGAQASGVQCTVTTRNNYSSTFNINGPGGAGPLHVAPNSSASIDLFYTNDLPAGTYFIEASTGVNITSAPTAVATQSSPAGTSVETPISWLPYGLSRTLVCSGESEVCPLASGLDVQPEPDTDGDSLSDCIERFGVTDEAGNMLVDLPAHDANPYHKDVFVEIDYLAGQNHDHRPLEDAIKIAKEVMAHLPVQNPDGQSGVTLHVDDGQPRWSDSGSNAFVLFDSTPISFAHVDVLKEVPLEAGGIGFAYNRRGIFHYCVYAHETPRRIDEKMVLGNSRRSGLGPAGGDFIVALGEMPRDKNIEAATFLHELGHNLGLQHGGGDPVENKPNYRSLMNYLYTPSLRFSTAELPAPPSPPKLAENHLREWDGIGAAGEVYYYCPPRKECPYPTSPHPTFGTEVCGAPLGTAIDWNCNRIQGEEDVTANINGDYDPKNQPVYGDLIGFADKPPSLDFDGIRGGAEGSSGASMAELEPDFGELTAAEYLAMPDPVHQVVEVVTPTISLGWGETQSAVFRIANVGFHEDTYDFSAYSTAGYPLAGEPGPVALLPISLGGGQERLLEVPLTAPAEGVPGISALVLRVTGRGRPEFADEVSAEIEVAGQNHKLFGDGFESGDVHRWSGYCGMEGYLSAAMEPPKATQFWTDAATTLAARDEREKWTSGIGCRWRYPAPP